VASAINISRPDSVQDKIFAAQHRRCLGEIGDVLSRSSFWVPEYICPSAPAWIEHAPFAFWICDALRPRRFVELGTHYGYSYFAFCQAIDRLALGTVAYAVDTWQGDEHAGFYDEHVFQSVAVRNNQRYSAFSCLMRSTFEDALEYFEDGSVDLLHIDGRHFYDDVKHDFTIWRRKLTEDAVVLLHDTNVRERRFGVWKFFQEMAERHPSFQFYHGHGLGVLAPGERIPEPLAPLLQASSEPADQIRTVYAALGGALTYHAGVEDLRAEIEQRAATEAALRADIEQRAASEAALRAEVEQRAATEAALQADIEQHAATEVALRADIERRAATEAALRAEVEQRAAAEATLRNAVDHAKREAADWEARAEAVKADAATMRSELRSELTKANRERNERAAAAEALRDDLSSVRSELAAAQDVGRAALASLKSETAMASEAPRNVAWLTSVLQLLGLHMRVVADADTLRTDRQIS
jgi:Methyltransferase domain